MLQIYVKSHEGLLKRLFLMCVSSRTEIALHDASLLDMPYGVEINCE
jgi:hypothetical protein